MVVVGTTEQGVDDIDTFNLRLAVQGHALPTEVRADFTSKNKMVCIIRPFDGIANLRFMSEAEEKKLLSGWNEDSGWSGIEKNFEKKYGSRAAWIAMSRIGFNSDKSLALVHFSGGLYLLERKNGKWTIKFYVQTVAS